jgi:hypothetical protein
LRFAEGVNDSAPSGVRHWNQRFEFLANDRFLITMAGLRWEGNDSFWREAGGQTSFRATAICGWERPRGLGVVFQAGGTG